MVVGRRTNLHIKKVANKNIYLPTVVETESRYGELFQTNAEDYFFINRNVFPWHQVPDIAIGRPGYDNFLVGLGIEMKVAVIDATKTLVALHQTDKEGNKAGHKNPENSVNKEAIGKFNYRMGTTRSCRYFTDFLQQLDGGSQEKILIRVFERYHNETL
jgi:hypothetical protein